MAKKILITGASGFLGWQVCKTPPKGWELVGTYSQHAQGILPGTKAIQLELTEKDAVWAALKAIQPDAVLHLAAASNTAFCETAPDITRKLNVDASVYLAEMCAERHCKLLFTSSSQVYDGENFPFEEQPTPSPRNEYGRQKLEAEKKLLDINPATTIIRVAVMYGTAGPSTNNFLGQWKDAWTKGEAVTAFYDEIRSFLSGKSAATGINLLLEKGAEGIFNVGGGTAISRYEFAVLASRALNLPEATIISKSQMEVESKAFRPANLTMNLEKIKGLGFVPDYKIEHLSH